MSCGPHSETKRGAKAHERKKPKTQAQYPCNVMISKDKTFFRTWSVRTLHQAGALAVMMHELKRYEWEICLCKMRREGQGEFYYDEHRILTWGGKDGGHQDGVTFVLKPKASQHLTEYLLIF